MDKKILVALDIKEGLELITFLKGTELRMTSAFWYYSLKIEEWQLMIVTDMVEAEGSKKAYKIVLDAIKYFGKKIDIPFESIYMVSPENSLNNISDYAENFEPQDTGKRFLGNFVRRQFFHDAYLYRV